MKLHENKNLFKEALTVTAQQLDLPVMYVEKDVCLARHFQPRHRAANRI